MSATTDTVPRGPRAKPRLKRSIGLWMATALVAGNMVGSGIFTLPAALSGEAGPASIVALAFTGVGALLLALVFQASRDRLADTRGVAGTARRPPKRRACADLARTQGRRGFGRAGPRKEPSS
jgi:hypothetical protein